MNLDLPKLQMRLNISIYNYIYVLKRNPDHGLRSPSPLKSAVVTAKPKPANAVGCSLVTVLKESSVVTLKNQNFSRVEQPVHSRIGGANQNVRLAIASHISA